MQVFVKLDSPVKVIVASVALDSQEQKAVQVLQAPSGSIQSLLRGENWTPATAKWKNENISCVSEKKYLKRIRRFTNKQSRQYK